MKVENTIANVIEEISNVKISDFNQVLIGSKCPVPLELYIVIICKLEDEYGYPISKIIEKNNFTIFTINNLSKLIKDLI